MLSERSSARYLVLGVILFSSLSCSSVASLKKQCAGDLGGQRLVTLSTLRSNLPSSPIVSGFDIDDTVLFSSPGFYYGMTNIDGPGGTNKYGTDVLRNGSPFWTDMNQQFDRFSLPKEAARAVLRMHQERGDGIVFITARFCSPEDRTAIARTLKAAFGLSEFSLDCTDNGAKTAKIEAYGVDIYYGDADTDMEYARAVTKKTVRPIRIQRSPLSTNKGGYRPGASGEEVLVNSEN